MGPRLWVWQAQGATLLAAVAGLSTLGQDQTIKSRSSDIKTLCCFFALVLVVERHKSGEATDFQVDGLRAGPRFLRGCDAVPAVCVAQPAADRPGNRRRFQSHRPASRSADLLRFVRSGPAELKRSLKVLGHGLGGGGCNWARSSTERWDVCRHSAERAGRAIELAADGR